MEWRFSVAFPSRQLHAAEWCTIALAYGIAISTVFGANARQEPPETVRLDNM